MAYRNLCFTWNNYTDEDYDLICKLEKIKYMVIAKEVGESGTPHLQGYVEFNFPKKFSALKKQFPKVHWEQRKGSAQQASDYCKKTDEKFFEYGVLSSQGKRTDIDNCIDLIKDGNRLKEVAKQFPSEFVKYHKGFKALQSELLEPRNFVPNVTVLYGETGTGKSRRARELLDDYYVWTPQRGTWFDGYEGQDNVIFEEFRGQLPFGMLLSLLDRYECPVQYKGGTTEFRGRNIVITSPKHPDSWYENCTDDKINQLLRRITKIENLGTEVLGTEVGGNTKSPTS